MSEILVPVSPGEVLDKITILRIKSARMGDAQKLANVRRDEFDSRPRWMFEELGLRPREREKSAA